MTQTPAGTAGQPEPSNSGPPAKQGRGCVSTFVGVAIVVSFFSWATGNNDDTEDAVVARPAPSASAPAPRPAPPTITPSRSPTPDKYQQTWTKPYSQTTCRDYSAVMTSQQRFVAAASAIASLTDRLPSDELAASLVAETVEACSAPAVAAQPFNEIQATVMLIAAPKYGTAK